MTTYLLMVNQKLPVSRIKEHLDASSAHVVRLYAGGCTRPRAPSARNYVDMRSLTVVGDASHALDMSLSPTQTRSETSEARRPLLCRNQSHLAPMTCWGDCSHVLQWRQEQGGAKIDFGAQGRNRVRTWHCVAGCVVLGI